MAINIEPNIKQNLRLVDILYLQFRLYKVVKLIRSLLRKLLLPFHSIFSHHKINKNNYYNFNDNYIIKTDFVNLLEKYQKNKDLRQLPLIKQSRLSVMPVNYKCWKVLNKMGSI